MTPFIQSDKKTRIAVDVFVSGFRNLVFQLKERLKKQGHSIRVVQHDNGRVKTATTLHEKLIEKGCELMLISDGN